MRFSRLYEQTAEFRSRCKAFDFAAAAQAVVDAVMKVRKIFPAMWARVREAYAPIVVATKQHQLVLELDGIAQIPMF